MNAGKDSPAIEKSIKTTKEKIKFYTEWSKLFMVVIITITAGLISLIRNKENSTTEHMLITLGFVFTFISTICLSFLTIRILYILKSTEINLTHNKGILLVCIWIWVIM